MKQFVQALDRVGTVSSTFVKRFPVYVTATIKTADIKQKKVPASYSRRRATYAYHLTLPDGTSKQVCKINVLLNSWNQFPNSWVVAIR
ncbi:hypothetical protein PoB_007345200 [Plakobranchus ocellatus]|uniref:Uncharacterized protein n=1 Tax=Plakobranchus ocellatus TaxID=259542 RepID=A0AAV4DRM0_9GAST|nr:hypothetical protein PoB_007345200 [Plakobranchus ocellatus]